MILLDTHAALWLELAPEKLSRKVRARLHDAETNGEPMAVSCITLWEIAQKHARGQLQLFVPCEVFLASLQDDFVLLPIDAQVALFAAGLDTPGLIDESLAQPFPKDPMDRLIAGTALARDLTLITRDERILAARACKTLW